MTSTPKTLVTVKIITMIRVILPDNGKYFTKDALFEKEIPGDKMLYLKKQEIISNWGDALRGYQK